VKTESEVTVIAMNNMKIPVTTTIIVNQAARTEVSVMGMTQISCVNGDSGWQLNPFNGGSEAEPMTADMVKQIKESTEIAGSLINYKRKGYQINNLGKEDLEGTEVYKIKVDKGEGRTEYCFIDPTSWLEIKNVTVATVDGQEQTGEQILSNYKEVHGVLMPHTIESNDPGMGGSAIINLTKVVVNEAVDPKIFDFPKK
jgi:hypothetical protein